VIRDAIKAVAIAVAASTALLLVLALVGAEWNCRKKWTADGFVLSVSSYDCKVRLR